MNLELRIDMKGWVETCKECGAEKIVHESAWETKCVECEREKARPKDGVYIYEGKASVAPYVILKGVK